MDRTWVRRPLTIGGLSVLAVLLLVTLPLWILLGALFDLPSGRLRFPTVRLLAFLLAWSWLEIAGVLGAAATWCVGRARNMRAQYALQRWWAASIMRALRITCGLRIEVEGARDLPDGPLICMARHASFGDALVSAWIIGSISRRFPRYVMKKELLFDPCLDIVGQRIPNWFVDRGSAAVRQEMEGIRGMAQGMGHRDVAVIFPEGTRASDEKRAYLVGRIERRSPERHARMSRLEHLLPPRTGGVETLLAAVPSADVVLLRHTGFDGLESVGGIHRAVAEGRTRARVSLTSIRRSEVPSGDRFGPWLDDRWLEMDAQVAAELRSLGLRD